MFLNLGLERTPKGGGKRKKERKKKGKKEGRKEGKEERERKKV